jgi:hypothetical protein
VSHLSWKPDRDGCPHPQVTPACFHDSKTPTVLTLFLPFHHKNFYRLFSFNASVNLATAPLLMSSRQRVLHMKRPFFPDHCLLQASLHTAHCATGNPPDHHAAELSDFPSCILTITIALFRDPVCAKLRRASWAEKSWNC